MNTKTKKVLISTGVIMVAMASQCFAADPLYEKLASIVEETIVPWTRLIGGLSFICAIIGAAWARKEQSDNLKGWLSTCGVTFAVLFIPEILNWMMDQGSSQAINFD